MPPGPHQPDADGGVARADLGVGQLTARGADGVGVAQTAVGPHRQRPESMLQGQAAGQAPVDALPLPGEGTSQAGGQLGGHVAPHHVDHPGQGVGAVEQGPGPAHHLDALGGHGLDGHRVVRGGGRQIAGALPVLEHQQAVAAQPAQHRPRGRRPHGALGDPRLVVDGLGDGAAQVLAQLAAAEDHLRFLQRGEVDPFALDDHGPHRDRLVADLEIDVGRVPDGYLDLEAGLVVADAQAAQDVDAGGHVGEEEVPPGVAGPGPFEILDDHGGPTHGLAALVVDHVAGQGAGLAAGGCRGQTQEEQAEWDETQGLAVVVVAIVVVVVLVLVFIVVIVFIVVVVVLVGILARAAFLDVDLDLLGDEVGVPAVKDLEDEGGLPLSEADDVEGPGAVQLVLLDLGDGLVADLPAQGETIVGVGLEEVAVLGDEAHREQGRLPVVAHLDDALDLAVLLAHDLLAAAADDQTERFGVFFVVGLGVDGVGVVAAPRQEGEEESDT